MFRCRLAHVMAALGVTLLSVTIAWGSAPAAAQTGTVSGEVIDASSGEAVSGAQISVPAENLNTLSDGSGEFTLDDVPAGEVTLDVSSLGYESTEFSVDVPDGETVEVTIELQTDALRLEEVVATGTGGEVERRQVGADLRAVSMDDIREQMPISSLGGALQGRVSGVRSVGTAGGVGAGRELSVRGTSSFLLGQRPVIYVDGVRIDTRNETWSGGMADGTCCAFDGGAGHERLSDLSPEDIERVEVLRGAAATTLYGSEASNGVIQIFTRGGDAGMEAQWRASSGVGWNRHRGHWATKLYPNFTGPEGFQAFDANQEMIENGLITDHSISVRGGHDDVGYYVSGSFLNEQGSVQPNAQTRGNLRVNLDWRPSDRWSFDVTSNYTRNEIEALQSGNNWTALLGNAILGNPREATEDRPFGEPWVDVQDIRQMETISDTDRFTGSLTTSFAPRGHFNHRLTLGLDAVTDQNLRHFPFGNSYVYAGTGGEKNVGYRQFRSYTVDYLGELQFDMSSSLGSSLSWGAQGFWETERASMSTGRGYSGPGVTTVGGGSITFGDEQFEEVINIGLFAQNRFAYDDRLFFTAGFRADGNSAFGEDFGVQFYPKVDAAYDLMAHDLPTAVSSMRLRGAVGMSGMTPGAFDQFRTFDPTAVLQNVPGVTPANPGNPELEPERTTEAEAGFETNLWERFGVDFTYFYSLTTDALLPISLPPSEGFGDSQLQNVGETRNKGFELELSSVNYESAALRWATDFQVDYTDNEVLDLGPQAQDGELAGFREGFPVRGQWADGLVEFDEEAGEHIVSDTAVYHGPQRPDWNFALSNTVQVGNFRIYAQLTAERGAVFGNGDRSFRTNFLSGDEYISRLDAEENATPAADSLFNYHDVLGAIDSRDNIRLQELAVGYQVPEHWTDRLGIGATSIDVSAQNVYWWDECYCADPNIQYTGGDDTNFSGFLADPQPRRFMARIQTTF